MKFNKMSFNELYVNIDKSDNISVEYEYVNIT
jgi:hypothetical protein